MALPAERAHDGRRDPGGRGRDADRARRREPRHRGQHPAHEIGQVDMGKPAALRFTAFNQRTTPELNGEVVRIGADVTQEEKKNESYYAVRIRLADGELARLEGSKLIAGMPVEAFIQTSPRTVMSYLVKPMRDQIARAFKGR